jgi:hypothetical protein
LALAQLGRWEDLARLSPEPAAAEVALEPAAAETVVWLALARARLGQPDAAAVLAGRHGARIEDAGLRALLELAATGSLTADSVAQLPSAVGALAASVRTQLGQLPPLPAEEAAGRPVRSANGRSGQEG